MTNEQMYQKQRKLARLALASRQDTRARLLHGGKGGRNIDSRIAAASLEAQVDVLLWHFAEDVERLLCRGKEWTERELPLAWLEERIEVECAKAAREPPSFKALRTRAAEGRKNAGMPTYRDARADAEANGYVPIEEAVSTQNHGRRPSVGR